MADQQEQSQRDAPKGHELRVRAGHAVPLAVNLARSFFLDQPFEGKVDHLAARLAEKHGYNFELAGGKNQCRVNNAQCLGQQGQVCAE